MIGEICRIFLHIWILYLIVSNMFVCLLLLLVVISDLFILARLFLAH